MLLAQLRHRVRVRVRVRVRARARARPWLGPGLGLGPGLRRRVGWARAGLGHLVDALLLELVLHAPRLVRGRGIGVGVLG